MKLIVLIFAALMNRGSCDVSDDERRYTYGAAVMEYLPITNYSVSVEDRLNMNAVEYINRLKDIETTDLDLVLFPEATLGGGTTEGTEVPSPFSEIICNSSDTKYKDYLKRFSCAAIEHETTIIVNLIEKVNCTLNNATGYCPSTGIIYHNSDVAFNESGGVSGRYRKWNLFGEAGKSPPAEAELVTIKTKNDSFGIFTCFDIMFGEPALNLTRKLGLRNILFPTMWYSELPYLTALQVQQMWAVENDVNFLSAGANEPRVGSGGTGIFIGKEGPLDDEIIGGVGGSKIIVKRVPRLEIENNPYKVVTPMVEDTDALAAGMDSFYLLMDSSVYNYSSTVLNTTNANTIAEVCNGDTIRICCQFDIKITVDQNLSSTADRYTYHLAAFNGVRTFSGVRDGGIESCGVIACLNDSISSCGQRFSNYSGIVWPITFENISIVANFTKNENRIQFPNSLLSSIRPISPQFSTWSKEELSDSVKRTHILKKPQNRLLTFGIFGRDFSRDGLVKPEGNDSPKLTNINVPLLLCITVSAIWVIS